MGYQIVFQENLKINIHIVKKYKYLTQVSFSASLCVKNGFVSDTFKLRFFGYLKELTNFCKIL